eukprot:m.20067 g.20067  ORF g.20067 m.20067 type:complete len:249 (+) comp6742_c0_seq1:151-897(+)
MAEQPPQTFKRAKSGFFTLPTQSVELANGRHLKFKPRTDWEPNSSRKTCKKCDQPFTSVRRRHHCRVCGGIFCYKCSPLLDLPKGKDFPNEFWKARCCEACYEVLNATFQEEDSYAFLEPNEDDGNISDDLEEEYSAEDNKELNELLQVPMEMLELYLNKFRADEDLEIQACKRKYEHVMANIEAIINSKQMETENYQRRVETGGKSFVQLDGLDGESTDSAVDGAMSPQSPGKLQRNITKRRKDDEA